MSSEASRPFRDKGLSGPKRWTQPIIIHRMRVGETALADEGAVLEMLLAGSAAMIFYDRAQRLAAAAHFPLPEDSAEDELPAPAVPFKLLALLVARGCDPEGIEVYAVGPGPSAGLGVPVALVCRTGSRQERRRVEFDVAMGRIVVEGDRWP
jgi:hypothetical protein